MIARMMPYAPTVMILSAYACIIYETWHEVKPTLSKKDCMLAEFSPDFSQKEKEICRELRGKVRAKGKKVPKYAIEELEGEFKCNKN